MDGAPANLLFDTGASMTTLTATAAERLNLLHNGNMRITSHGIGGKSEAIAANVASFRLADMELKQRTVMVIPFELRGFKQNTPDGLLGFDVFSQYDVEIDLQSGRGTFYRPRNCPSAVPNWQLSSNRFVVPPTTQSGKLLIEVELDGKRLIATVDTGAASTLLSTAAATRLGITDAQLAGARSIAGYGIAPTDAQMRVLRFRELRVGQETAKTPELAITDLPPGAGDMLLGMNYLRSRKLWISLSSRTFHLSVPQTPAR
ncbi:MAG: retroviral-like aspartic protease family protein [Alphaproteobacteria bacterium]|nr:retroviral-like aspartic protease family protein [Alphaproteobacteria bacterium]